jgi:hypothetical protein
MEPGFSLCKSFLEGSQLTLLNTVQFWDHKTEKTRFLHMEAAMKKNPEFHTSFPADRILDAF